MANDADIKSDSDIEEGDDRWFLLFPALGGGLIGMRMGSEVGGLIGGIVGFLVGGAIGGGGAFIALILLATGG